MSTPVSTNDTIAMLCAPSGAIDSIIIYHDYLHGTAGLHPTFQAMLAPAAAKAADAMLAKALESGCANDRELAPRMDRQKWHFIGAATSNGHIAVIGSATSDGLARLCASPPPALVGDALLMARLKRASASIASEPDSDGRLIEELGQMHSEMAAIQRELAKRNSELAYREVEKNRLIGFVAHDLRNPLGVINGYASLLLEDAYLTADERHQYLDGIARAGQTVLRMVNDLLDLAKIESGKLRLDLGDISLGDLVLQQVELNRILARAKQIELRAEISPGLPLMQVDAGRIGQVLDNLLTNAIKFSNPGSEVSVRVSRDDRALLIAVEDHGLGIPADELGNLFQPFGRTSVRPTGGESSTGLGLAISRRIVEAHKGRIEVDSTGGLGSTFRVILPITLTR
jgi:signal transduction histidine kinase